MKDRLAQLGRELGLIGIVSLALIGGCISFTLGVIQPAEQRKLELMRQADSPARTPAADRLTRISAPGQAGDLEAFYRYFDRSEGIDEWLAKIYGAATASGIALRSGDYRLAETGHRISRYEITLPVTGTYAQIRAFTEAALAEIPVLSLDQISFRRSSGNEGRVEAEIVLTLHVPRK